ncbi:hypothetical protein PQX77_002034 [Marasmius sp. AFHP31]|nr:hypothetical protein PQX77_002034 [Marasmius sp. AFHP31]
MALPLAANTVAAIGDESYNRVLHLQIHEPNPRLRNSLLQAIKQQAQKFGGYGRVDCLKREQTYDIYIHFFKAKNSQFVDLMGVKVKKEYSLAGDPCENKIPASEFPIFDRVLVKNLPEGMKLHNVPRFLQPELERFRSIYWAGSQRYVISFLNHADASRFMDVASAKYETEREMRNIKITPVGTTDARGRTQYVQTAAALGATRTIILSGIVDEKLFSKSRIIKDFSAFGKPYLVSWHPEQLRLPPDQERIHRAKIRVIASDLHSNLREYASGSCLSLSASKQPTARQFLDSIRTVGATFADG